MTPVKPEDGRYIQRDRCHLESGTFSPFPVVKQSELKVLLHDPVGHFPAADVLMLVAAAHVGETPLFKRFKRHGCSIMIAGKKITGLVRQALPALEAERLRAQIQRTAMDKEHPVINPLHGHGVEDGEERGVPQLLMAVRACSIAPADEEAVEVCMVMVPENGDEAVLPGEGMDFLESFLGPVTAVEEIAEIDEDIHRAEPFTKERGLDAGCKCSDGN